MKLKGGLTVKGGKIKKVKRHPKKSDRSGTAITTSQLTETTDGYALPSPSEEQDRRTPAEKKFEEKVAKREMQKAKTQVMKSHREKVKEFNEYLARLTEHHDIPKVGPG